MRSLRMVPLYLVLAMGLLHPGVDEAAAQTGTTTVKTDGAAADRLKERAERVQQRRKARITQAQREAAAARAKAKATTEKAAPRKDGKGGAQ